jgi:hypothetical protein
LARFGEDDSVVYLNRGGRCRIIEKWTKATAVESANRVHRLAIEHGATEVRVDASGLGGPIVDLISNMTDGKYTLISMLGSAASPDNNRWLNARAYHFDSLREQMIEGKLDLDPDDKQLIEEMLMLQYKFSQKGAIQIESKDDMRSRGVKSPDHLDALVYATVNLDHIINSPYADKKPGEVISMELDMFDNSDPFLGKWIW